MYIYSVEILNVSVRRGAIYFERLPNMNPLYWGKFLLPTSTFLLLFHLAYSSVFLYAIHIVLTRIIIPILWPCALWLLRR